MTVEVRGGQTGRNHVHIGPSPDVSNCKIVFDYFANEVERTILDEKLAIDKEEVIFACGTA